MVYKPSVTSVPTDVYNWREVLRQQGRSIAWLADRTGVARATVYSYSMGRRKPNEAWLNRVAVELGIGGL